jgi:UDP-glucose 4-epimerase
MKIMVTGGAGFIGSHLVDRLVQDRAGEVVVIDDFSRGQIEHLSQSRGQISVVNGDIRDSDLLKREMSGVSVVYHLAAQSNVLDGFRDPDVAFESNVIGTYRVLREAQAAGVKRVVFSSSREVYGDPVDLPVNESAPVAPKNAYGVSKAACELYCRLAAQSGMEVVILRLSNVYGSRDRGRVIPLFIEQARKGMPLTIFGREKTLDFLWIENLVAVLCELSRKACPDHPVNVGSGKGVKLIALAERIRTLTGGASKIDVVEERAPEVSRFVADITCARELFDLRCPQDPLEYLPILVEQYRSQI